MKKVKNSDGYTLMELLTVIAIIAILVSVSVPVYTRYVERAKETVLYDKAYQIQQALVLCELEYLEEGTLDESVFWNDEFLKAPNDPDSILYPYIGSMADDCIGYSVKWGEYEGDKYRIKGFVYETEEYIVKWNRDEKITVTKK